MDVNYAYYSSAKGFRVVGGTAAQFLKADGSVDNNTYPTTTQADSKYLTYTGALTNVNLNAKNISNVGSVDATVFRNGNSSVLVKSFALQNTTTVTSLGVKLTTPNSSNMMGSFTVTMFGYIGQTISFRVSMYKFQNNWFGPSITWVHGDSSKISNIEFYKEDDSNLHIKVNFVTNFGTYNKTVITDVLANGASEVLHNPDLYTISVNPDNSAHTLQQTVANTQIVRDTLGDAPKTPIYLASSDLNTVVLPGFYYQLADANATVARNYPTTTAGALNVYRSVSTGVIQEYTTYGTVLTYKRSYTGGLWTPWRLMTDSINGGNSFITSNTNQTGLSGDKTTSGNWTVNGLGVAGNINSTSGELIIQRLGVNKIRTGSAGSALILSGETSNGSIILRPQGDAVGTNQVLFNGNNTSQYTDSHNILLGTQTSVGSSVFHTAVANLLSGYGAWIGHNLQWDGTNFIQPRGNLHSWGFTANNHKGFSFNFGLSAGTNGGVVSLNEILKIDSTGQITTANNGNSTQWSTAFGWGNHALAGYATTTQIGAQIANSAFPRQLTTTNVIDCNNQTLEGVYYGYQWLNQPILQASAIASLTVKRYSNDWIRQEWNFIDGSGLTYVRDRYNGTTWSSWKIVAYRDWVTSQLASYVTQTSLNTQLGSYATLAGTQTFSNTITFNQSPLIPYGTLAFHAINLAQLEDYVDVNNAAILNNISNAGYATESWCSTHFITLHSPQDVTGQKTFTVSPKVPSANYDDEAIPFGQSREIAIDAVRTNFLTRTTNLASDVTYDFSNYGSPMVTNIVIKGNPNGELYIDGLDQGMTIKILNTSALNLIVRFDGGSLATGIGQKTWIEVHRDSDGDLIKNDTQNTIII